MFNWLTLGILKAKRSNIQQILKSIGRRTLKLTMPLIQSNSVIEIGKFIDQILDSGNTYKENYSGSKEIYDIGG